MFTIEDVVKKYEEYTKKSYTVDRKEFPMYREGDIIDEEKSVRWNREEVERRNQAYEKEVNRLAARRRLDFQAIINLAVDYIMQETSLNNAQSTLIWNYVYDEYHAHMSDVFDALEEVIELQNSIKRLA